jgi:hypothetical protein
MRLPKRSYHPSVRRTCHLSSRAIAIVLAVPAVLGCLPFESRAASPNAPLYVARAAYRAGPHQDRLQLTAELELRQSVAGQQTLPLELGAMSLESATLDGQPAPLLRTPDGRVVLFLVNAKPGTSKLQLRMSAPLHRIGRDRSAIVRPIGNAPATLTVEVPANRSLRIDGKLVSRAKPLGEKTQYRLAVGNRGHVELRFTSEGTGSGLDSVVLAESRSTLAISAALADWQCETRFHVTGTPRKTFESSIAGPMQITGVTGADVAEWSVAPSKDDPSRSTVRVTFRRPFTGVRSVRYSGRTALPSEPFWQVPNFVIAGVESHAGHVAVSFPRNEAIRVDEFAGLRQSAGLPEGPRPKIVPVKSASTARKSRTVSVRPDLDPRNRVDWHVPAHQGPDGPSGPTFARKVLAFDFWKQDFELNLVLPKRKHGAAADAVTVFDVRRDRVRMEFTAAWETRESQKWASLSLPAEWSIRSVAVNERPADWKTLPVEAAVQHLRIALRPQKSRSVSARPDLDPRNRVDWHVPAHQGPDGPSGPTFVRLAVTAVRDLEYPDRTDAAAVWKLPVVRLPDSRLMRGELFVRSSDSVSIGITNAKELQPIRGRRDVAEAASFRGSRWGTEAGSFGYGGDRYAYRYMLRPRPGAGFSATVSVRPKPPGFSVASLTIAKLDRAALRTSHEIEVTPEGGGFRTLELLLPKDAGQRTSMRWNGAEARLLHSERVSTETGRARWRLTFDRTVLQPGRLLLDLTLPRPNARVSVALDCVRFPDAERTTGYVVVLAGERQHLTIVANYAIPSANNGGTPRRRPLPLAEVAVEEAVRRFAGKGIGVRHRFDGSGSRAVAAFRYVVPKIDVSVTEARLSGDATVSLICRRRSLQSIVTAAGAMQHHVEYELQGNGVHALNVQLPEGAELWAALCNGRPVEVRRARSLLVLPLSHGWPDPDRMSVELNYHQKSAALGRSGRLQLAPPTIAVASDGSPLVIRRSTWTLYHPAEVDVANSAGDFRAVQPLDRSGWLKRLGSWAAARSLMLLVLLLAVPFAWIALRFLRTVGQRDRQIRSWPRIAVSLLAGGVLVAVALSGRWRGTINDADRPSLKSAEFSSRTAFQAVRPVVRQQVRDIGVRGRLEKPSYVRNDRVSVPVQFSAPSMMAVKRFEYLGIADREPSLDLAYETRAGGVALRLCVIVGILLACWILRLRSRRFLGTLAVLGLALPPALAGWSAVEWQPFVDGVFFGTLACAALWGLCAAIAGVKLPRRIPDGGVPNAARVLARLLPLAALIVTGSQSVVADATPPASPGFVSAANYAIAMKDATNSAHGSAHFTARFDIVSIGAKPASIALPLGRVAVVAASLDGTPAAVNWRTTPASAGTAPDAVPCVVVPKPGRHVLQLAFSLPLETDGAGSRFLLPLRPVASGQAVLTLPSQQLQLRFRGLVGTYRRTIRNGNSIVEFPVDKSRDVVVELRGAAKPAPAAAAVVVESATSNVDVKDGGVFQRDKLTLRVVNGSIDNWTFLVPGEQRVIGIDGKDVAGWELSPPKSGSRTVRIDFRRRIAQSTAVVFHMFRAARFASEPASIVLRPVRAASAIDRDRTVSVNAGREFVVAEGKIVGAKRIAATTWRKLPASGPVARIPKLAASATLTWKLTAPESSVALRVSRRTPQTAVAAEHAVLVDADAVRIASRLSFDFLGFPRTKVSLLLPEGYTLHSLRGTHGAEWSHGADETSAIVVFPKPQSGTVRVVLDGTLRRKPSSSTVQLPLPGPMAAGRLDVTAGVWHAAGLTARVKAAGGWKRIAAGEVPAVIRARHLRQPVAVLRTNSSEPTAIALEVAQPHSTVNAESLTLVRVTDTAVHYTLLLKWSGVAGARRSVAFSVPGWIGRRLDLRLNRHLRIERQAAAHGGNDRMRWIVTDFDDSSRDVTVVAAATLPPPLASGNRVAAPKLELQRRAQNGGGQSAEYAAVNRPQHFVVLTNESAGRLQRPKVPRFRSFVAADLRQPFRISEGLRSRISNASERLRLDEAAAPAWTIRPLLSADRNDAVVNRAELTTTLERDGCWRMRAVYRMKNGRRPYFAVKLPENSRLLSAVVAGRPAQAGRLRRNGNEYHVVPLPRGGSCQLPSRLPEDRSWQLRRRAAGLAIPTPDVDRREGLTVSLLIVGRLPEGAFRSAGLRSLLDGSVELSLPAPRVVSRDDDADLGIPVQETRWTVHLADGLYAVSVGDSAGEISRYIPCAVADRSIDALADGTRSVPATMGRDDARELYRLNCNGGNDPHRRGKPIRPRFAFPLDDEADRTASTTCLSGMPAVVNASFQRPAPAAIPWAASVDWLGDAIQTDAKQPEFDISAPDRGQTLTFRKAGGDPQLMLRVRTRDATRKRRRILWSVVWLAFGLVALLVVRRKTVIGSRESLATPFPKPRGVSPRNRQFQK